MKVWPFGDVRAKAEISLQSFKHLREGLAGTRSRTFCTTESTLPTRLIQKCSMQCLVSQFYKNVFNWVIFFPDWTFAVNTILAFWSFSSQQSSYNIDLFQNYINLQKSRTWKKEKDWKSYTNSISVSQRAPVRKTSFSTFLDLFVSPRKREEYISIFR